MKKILIVLCIAGCGICSAIDDYLLVKSSPFYQDERNPGRLTKDRINAWPFFYSSQTDLSVLWPMIAVTDAGNAVYPLYSWYYGEEFNLFWPLSSFDLDDDGGKRILNTYWDKDSFISVPFFFKDEDYWLAMFVAGMDSNEWYSVMPPMWIHWYADDSWFCLPAMTAYKHDADGYSYTTFPLYHQSRDYEEFMSWAVWSMYMHWSNPKESYTHVFPLLFSYENMNTNNPERVSSIFPLYLSSRTGTDSMLFTPLFGLLRGENTRGVVTPLVSSGHVNDTHFFNLAGLLYHHNWNDTTSSQYTHIVYPLFSLYQSLDTLETKVLWPLFSYERNSTNSFSYSILPLYSYTWNKLPGPEERQSISTVYPYCENRLWILPWILHKTGIQYKTTDQPADEKEQQEAGVRSYDDQYYLQTHDYRLSSFWPFWKYENAKEFEREFSMLTWLYTYNQEWDEQKQEHTRARVLWRWLMYERRGKDIAMDIFPFITYDKKPEEAYSQFSVLWRLYRFEKEGNQRNLNLFFIPFSWGGE